ncbi:phosphotransferase family protein [uncultured Cellulomonas sp.]|uniref:phosphotransferase family protein n=1 Tax=uncultured Cellulomonas sp. TaxID=189682 RepID=UPI002631844C|nr:phosphotransferase [uncultured Cellulomonas sp.]
MTAWDRTEPPVAFSGSRLGWQDLPRPVRARIAERAGAEVIAETGATSGFSPGFASVLELGDGREVFVKAVSSEQNPHSPELARREIAVAPALPDDVPAPRLLWSDDDGTWVVLAFEAVHGRSPVLPWRPDDLVRVLAVLDALATTAPVEPHALEPVTATLAEEFTGWRRLADGPVELVRQAAGLAGEPGAWALEHLDELVEREAGWARAAAGDALVHGDLRADNVILDDATCWLVDWPHAGVGAAWLDLALMLPSVAMQGGGDPDVIFRAQRVAADVDDEALRAVLTALAGYFAHGALQPAPPGIPNLRRFQAAQALATIGWLRALG